MFVVHLGRYCRCTHSDLVHVLRVGNCRGCGVGERQLACNAFVEAASDRKEKTEKRQKERQRARYRYADTVIHRA